MRVIVSILAILLSACSAGAQNNSRVFQPLYSADTAFPPRSFCDFEIGSESFTGSSLSTGMTPFNNTSTGGTIAEQIPFTGYGGNVTVGAYKQFTAGGATDDMGVRTNTTLLKPGSYAVSFYAVGREGTVSDGTNRITERIGLIDADGVPTDGVFFRYVDNVNSGKWEAVTRNAGTETATNTNVTFTATTVREFRIEINAGWTSVDFYIDGVKVVAGQSTNIPGATAYTGVGWVGTRSVGTTASIVTMDMDYIAYKITFNTARC